MDAMGTAGEILFEGGGVLGCAIEPAPGKFSMLASSLSIKPRYVVVNQLPVALCSCVQISSKYRPPAGSVAAASSPAVALAVAVAAKAARLLAVRAAPVMGVALHLTRT